MSRKTAILAAFVAAITAATPVLAASGDVCLQHNRIKTWKAVDDRTLVFTDMQDKQYTVHMANACQGVTNGGAILTYQTWTNLGCLDRGNIINVRAPGLIESSCSIASVTAGAPSAAPG
jgi:hypothetical protein